MRWPIVALLALTMAAATGCPNPASQVQKPSEKKTGNRKFQAPGGGSPPPTTYPSPTKSTLKPSGSPSGGSSASPSSSLSPGASSSPVPTPTPPNGTVFPTDLKPSAEAVFRFVPQPGAWVVEPSLNRARAGLTAAGLGDRLIVAEGDHRPSLEYFLLGASGWDLSDSHDQERAINKDSFRTLHQGLSLASGAVYNKIELWTVGGLAGPLSPLGETGLDNFNLYRSTQPFFTTARKADEGQFKLTKGRYAAAGGVVGDRFIVAGGINKPGEIVNTVELLTLNKLTSNKEVGTAMPIPVAGAACVGLDKFLYVIGGYKFESGKPKAVADVQVYDPEAKKWYVNGENDGNLSLPKALPVALHSAAATVYGGRIYVMGGFDNDGKPLDTVYNVFGGGFGEKWDKLAPLPTARGLLAAATFSERIWAIGGVGTEKKALQTVESFRP